MNQEAERKRLWKLVQAVLRNHVPREQFETWFRRTSLLELDDDTLRFAGHSAFARDWLRDHYGEVLHHAVQFVLGAPRHIEVESEQTPPSPIRRGSVRRAAHHRSPGKEGESKDLLGSSHPPLDINYRFDNFVVGPCNRLAYTACRRIAENPGKARSPLFLHGSVGLGKTHLLQSLYHAVVERTPAARILHLTCATLVDRLMGALKRGELTAFLDKYSDVDGLIVDDIDLLANNERAQEEFLHIFNTLYGAGKPIVLSSDSLPTAIPSLRPGLVSRFRWGVVALLEPPCSETRVAITKLKSRQHGRELPHDVARFIAERMGPNICALEVAVIKVICFASLSGQDMSLQLARQCLK